MDLPAYIEQLGDEEAAKRFNVPIRTVASWRRGERKPRPKQAEKIISDSGGKVTFEGIYASIRDSRTAA